MAPNGSADNLALAFQSYQQGQLTQAAAYCQRALKKQPNRHEALQLLFGVRFAEGKLDEALALIKRAVAADPKVPQSHNNMGLVLGNLGRHDEALACYAKALAIRPDYPQALNNRGNALASLGRFDEAFASYDRALALAPDYAEAHYNRGAALSRLNRHQEAIPCYEKALALQPRYVEALNNLGIALSAMKRPGDALLCFDRALAIRPDYVEALNSRGNVLCLLNRYEDAYASYRRALEIRPKFSEAHSSLIFALEFLPGTGFAEHQGERRQWYERHGRPLARLIRPHENDRDPERTLRIGYVSGDFCRHSAAAAFGPVVRNHDKARFEAVLYSNGKTEDEVTQTLRASATEWRPITWLADDAVAERVREDRIDILVDLSGHTEGNRLLVFARKPAPIQVTAWGHATGTGLPAIDYLFSDPVAVPLEVRPLFAETLYDLPCIVGYEAPVDSPAVAPAPAASDHPITFGCFNRLAKVSGDSVALWARLLKTVPESRLALKDVQLSDPAERQRIADVFAAHGIDERRLMLLPGTPHLEHMAAYGGVDIGLDPIPVSGGVTTMEALWMGVPVVSLLGSGLASRVSAAIMSALGLTAWVAASSDDYVAIAARMAANPAALADLRRSLRPRMLASPIATPQAYCRAVEEAYRTMWRDYCRR